MNKRFGATDGLVIFCVVSWGVNYGLVKMVLMEMNPFTFSLVRYGLVSLVFLALYGAGRPGAELNRKDTLRMGLLGVVGIGFFQLLNNSGLKVGRAANASILLAAAPVFTALYASAARMERVSARCWTGIVVALAGVYLVVGIGTYRIALESLRGDLLMLSAAASWGIYTALVKPLLLNHSPARILALSTLYGTLFMVPFAGFELNRLSFPPVSPISWLIILYNVASIVLTYRFWYRGIGAIGPTRTMIYSYLTPVTGIIFAVIWLGESIYWYQIAGCLVVIAGVHIARTG